MPIPHETDHQTLSDSESQDACQQGVEGHDRQAAQGGRGRFQKGLPGLEGEVEGHNKPQESPQGRKDALYSPEAQSSDEQPELLPTLPLHFPEGGMQGNAQHEQQD